MAVWSGRASLDMEELANRGNVGDLRNQISKWANLVKGEPGVQAKSFFGGDMRFPVTARAQNGEILMVEHD